MADKELRSYTTTCPICLCEYITTILWKLGFKDTKPKCPCCSGPEDPNEHF